MPSTAEPSPRQPSPPSGPTPREDQACLSTGKIKQAALTRLDALVDSRQFADWPDSTLCMARVVRATLICLVLTTTAGLVTSYFFGELGVETEVVKVTHFVMPNLVLCPVWGQKGLSLDKTTVAVGNLATTGYEDWRAVDFKAGPCADGFDFRYVAKRTDGVRTEHMANAEVAALGCSCFDLGELELEEERIGRLGVHLKFQALLEKSGGTNMIAVGFAPDKLYPNEWSYIETGKRNIGSLFVETRAYGKTPVTDGTTIDQFNYHLESAFAVPGEPQPSRTTDVVILPGSFFIREISDVSSIWSAFALFSILVLLMANLNSMSLFDLCFAEKVDAHDPDQMEPNWCLQYTFRSCPCCKKRQQPTMAAQYEDEL